MASRRAAQLAMPYEQARAQYDLDQIEAPNEA